MSKANEQLQPSDIWSMSEDELSRINPESLVSEETETVPDEIEPEVTPEQEPEQTEESVENNQDTPSEEETSDTQVEAETTEEETNSADTQKPTPKADTSAKSDPSAPTVPDYKEFYEALIGSPIKANGKDLILKSKEDVVQLIQKGANYHQKMAALKPIRRVVSMLEENGIRDEAEIGFLIDLHKRNPEAIAKLMKDSKIDLYDFNVDQGDSYQPKHQAPSDKQIELGDVISDLRTNHPGFNDMLTGIINTWDVESQNQMADNPAIFSILNTARESGNYDIIMQTIEQDRIMGRIPASAPMLQVYSHYERELMNAGRLNLQTSQPAQQPAQTQQATMSQLKNSQSQPSNIVDAKRKAAAPRTAPATTKTLPKDIFSLSPEEFAKIDPTQFN